MTASNEPPSPRLRGLMLRALNHALDRTRGQAAPSFMPVLMLGDDLGLGGEIHALTRDAPYEAARARLLDAPEADAYAFVFVASLQEGGETRDSLVIQAAERGQPSAAQLLYLLPEADGKKAFFTADVPPLWPEHGQGGQA